MIAGRGRLMDMQSFARAVQAHPEAEYRAAAFDRNDGTCGVSSEALFTAEGDEIARITHKPPRVVVMAGCPFSALLGAYVGAP
jgi:hypothetical protein